MVAVPILLAYALQAGSAPVDQPYRCSLVTPDASAVDFTIVNLTEASDELWLTSRRDSVWPLRTLVAERGGAMREPSGKRWFALGGSDGLVLEIGQGEPRGPIPTTLLRRDGRRAGLPIAIGFCAPPPQPISLIYRALDPDAAPTEVGQNIAAFDPRNWPEDRCGMILSDGRRLPLRFALSGPGQVELASGVLWNRRAFTVPARDMTVRAGRSIGTFGRGNGPRGEQELLVQPDQGMAVKVIRFERVGDPTADGQTAYAICGYSRIVRRPTLQ